MRTLIVLLTFVCTLCYSQSDSTIKVVDADTIIPPAKWPYINKRTPPIIGITTGYNFLSDRYIEFGAIANLSDNYGHLRGAILGPSLSYKRYLDKNINSFNFDVGLYLYLAFGLGANYTYTDKEGIVGFKPFIGLSMFHIQATYGYNFFSEKHNHDMNLGHHSVNLRLAIPIIRLTKDEK